MGEVAALGRGTHFSGVHNLCAGLLALRYHFPVFRPGTALAVSFVSASTPVGPALR